MCIAYCYRQSKSTRAAAPESSRQNGTTSNGDLPSRPAPPQATSSPSPLTAGQSHQDRIATAKEKALKRVQERLAAAGIKTGDTGETLQQRQERERKEREDRVKKAEAEDAKREQERLQRLAKEGGTSPISSKSISKKPPPPPSRKGRQDSADLADKKAAEVAAKARAEEEAARELRAEQEAQEARRKQLEYVHYGYDAVQQANGSRNQTKSQEDELEKEREAAQARLRALEEQVKAGKVKKQEEKARKKAAEKEAREKEAKLAAQRAELEAARERERQLQLQLESLGDDSSSDEEGPQAITPQGTEATPTNSQILPGVSSPPASFAPEPSSTSSVRDSTPLSSPAAEESRNPYFKKLSVSSSSESGPPSAAPPPPPVPQIQPLSPPASAPKELSSTNPFHRIAQQEAAKPLTPTYSGPQSRRRPEEDEWSVAESEKDSSDDEGDVPTGGSAKHLASILFGTMAPPRPLSAMDSKPPTPVQDLPSVPAPFASSLGAPPPPPPPMPESGAPAAPPPPPPPMPGSSAPPPPPMPNSSAPRGPPTRTASSGGSPAVGALLGEIQAGKGLKKTVTRDRSTAAVAGRVLG